MKALSIRATAMFYGGGAPYLLYCSTLLALSLLLYEPVAMKTAGALLAIGVGLGSAREGQSKKCGGGEDMAYHEKIRIGVLYRPEVNNCCFTAVAVHVHSGVS